ncbi:MAG: hypothetical protein ACI4UK_10735, partial [Floccifex sp.]
EEIKQREKGIFYMVECANDISQSEKEWLEKIEDIRRDLDRNQRITNARLEGRIEGKREGIEIGLEKGEKIGSLNTMKAIIHTMYEKNQDIEFIAQMVNQSVEYVQNVLNEK